MPRTVSALTAAWCLAPRSSARRYVIPLSSFGCGSGMTSTDKLNRVELRSAGGTASFCVGKAAVA